MTEAFDSKKFVNAGLLWIPARFLTISQRPIMWHKEIIKTYVTYKELFENTEYEQNSKTDYQENIKQFKALDTLQTLAKLNCLSSNTYHVVKSNIPLDLLKPLASNIIRSRLIHFWKKGKFLITRQQLLASMKFTMLWNIHEKQNQIAVEEDLPSFLRLLYRVTDFLQDHFHRELSKCSDEKVRDEIMLANLATMQELSFLPGVPYLLLRYWILYTDCVGEVRKRFPKEDYLLHKRFNEITGLDLQLHILLVMSIWLYYHNLNLTDPSKFLIGPKFFARLRKEVKKKAQSIFSKMSADQEGFRKHFGE